jgi:hypothetical protein
MPTPQKFPEPIRLAISVKTTARCSAPGCLASHEVDALPLLVPDRSGVFVLDSEELLSSLPAEWIIGLVTFKVSPLIVMPNGPGPEVRELPVCFCPAHAHHAKPPVERER